MEFSKLLSEKEVIAINEFTREVKNFLGDNLIVIKLFGSKVKGKAEPGSDIDIYLLLKEVSPRVRDFIYDIAFNINLKYDLYISPRIISKELYENPIFKITPFIQSIEQEGITI